MKLRIPTALHTRARICAEEVDATMADWAGRALRGYRAGRFNRVADSIKSKSATRKGSVVVTLPGEQHEADEMRCALQSAVEYCEARRPPPPELPPLVEGVHYIVEKIEA